jgi:hypothetical protein
MSVRILYLRTRTRAGGHYLLDAATNGDILGEGHDGLLLVLKVVAEGAVLIDFGRTLICQHAFISV